MAGNTRRTLMAGLIAAGALAGLAGVPLALRAGSAAVRLPPGSMRLERTLLRDLRGGAVLTVRRSWEIVFARQAQGIIVTGRQIAASVEAPPQLAELARIEERRDTQGMFPLLLSDAGLILSAGAAPVAPEDLAAALRAAERMIAARPASPEQRESLARYLAEVHRAGSGQFDRLPGDLLFPAGTPQRHCEAVALPGGLTGEFELVWEARAVPGAGWLAEGERRIATRVQGLERRSRERWSLVPA